ncbi:MAG: flagellar biosynthetic protein FliQ [Planctomycetota bacterium]
MNGEFVLYIGRRALEVALMVAAPGMIAALSVGLLTALLQAITSIRDMTLGMVLKIGAVGAAMLIFGGWMMQVAVGFTMEIFNHMQALVQ